MCVFFNVFNTIIMFMSLRHCCIVVCSYSLAVEFQQQVIKAWDNHGDSAKDEMKEAKRLFEELRLKARGGVSTDKVSTKALPLPKK